MKVKIFRISTNDISESHFTLEDMKNYSVDSFSTSEFDSEMPVGMDLYGINKEDWLKFKEEGHLTKTIVKTETIILEKL